MISRKHIGKLTALFISLLIPCVLASGCSKHEDATPTQQETIPNTETNAKPPSEIPGGITPENPGGGDHGGGPYGSKPTGNAPR